MYELPGAGKEDEKRDGKTLRAIAWKNTELDIVNKWAEKYAKLMYDWRKISSITFKKKETGRSFEEKERVRGE